MIYSWTGKFLREVYVCVCEHFAKRPQLVLPAESKYSTPFFFLNLPFIGTNTLDLQLAKFVSAGPWLNFYIMRGPH